jgi:hypothetical protein
MQQRFACVQRPKGLHDLTGHRKEGDDWGQFAGAADDATKIRFHQEATKRKDKRKKRVSEAETPRQLLPRIVRVTWGLLFGLF